MKRALPLPLATVCVALWAPAAHAAMPSDAADPWFAPDKALHFGVSAGLASAGYAASSLLFEDRRARLLSGAGLALTAGIAKELSDLAGNGDPSWKDLTWDAVGTAVGLAVAWAIDSFVIAPLTHGPGPGPARGDWMIPRRLLP